MKYSLEEVVIPKDEESIKGIVRELIGKEVVILEKGLAYSGKTLKLNDDGMTINMAAHTDSRGIICRYPIGEIDGLYVVKEHE